MGVPNVTITMDQATNDYNAAKQNFEDDLKNLSSNAQVAYLQIMMVIMPAGMDLEGSSTEVTSATMDEESQLQNLTTEIQNDFNDEVTLYQNYSATTPDAQQTDVTTAEEADVTDAINAAVQILNIVNDPNGPFTDISSYVDDDLNSIFDVPTPDQVKAGTDPNYQFYTEENGVYVADYDDVQEITVGWNYAATIPGPVSSTSSDEPSSTSSNDLGGSSSSGTNSYQENTQLSQISSALGSLSTTVGNQASETGTQLQYQEGALQQVGSEDESSMQSYMQNITTLVGGQQTS